MKKEKHIVRYKASELPKVSNRDIKRLRAFEKKPVDFSDIPPLDTATLARQHSTQKPTRVSRVELPVEQEVVGWFKQHSDDYQLSMSHVLKHYMLSHRLPL